MVTDRGGGASEPMGIATGDFVFVGDLGRPDLLETAAGHVGSKEPSARALFQSVRKFGALPEYLQVWPAHGAGSACGKALGAVPQSTVGYERRFNPSIRAASAGEGEFVASILTGQPDPPVYFARMKRDNKLGPPVLGSLPQPARLTVAEAKALDAHAVELIDMRPWKEFKAGHIPGALWIPMDNMFPTAAGSFVAEDEPIYLCVDSGGDPSGGPALDEAVRCLVRIGLDDIRGWIDRSDMPAVLAARKPATMAEIDVSAARGEVEGSRVFLLDVRNESEFVEGHIPGACHTPYTRLADQVAELPEQRKILVNCKAGGRSGRACSYLRRAGYDVVNLAGGFDAWSAAGAPVER
jgi:hydroxyacylglutathione hydrolase